MTDTPAQSDSILEAAIALGPEIRSAVVEIDRGRRLTDHIVARMKQAGIFRMAMPRAWGGPELDPITQTRVIEEIARADGSAGWCAMINSDGGYFSAYLDQDIAREMYRDLDAPTGSQLVFSGQAEAASGGFRVSGQWPFVSGCQHSEWILVGVNMLENGKPRLRPDGGPERTVCFIRRDEGEVIDTWRTTGLRGSGSHDFAVRDLILPAERTYGFPSKPRREGPLYAFPMMFAYNVPGVALGIARNAIDTFVEIAERKVVTTSMLSARQLMLRDESYVQSIVARAEGLVGSARGYAYDRLDDIWRTVVAGDLPSPRQRALYRIAISHTHSACVEAVEMLYKAYGGSAVYESGPLDRHLRDLLTINQHTIGSLKVYETAGKVLLGLGLREPMF
jgi:alkylation response protein AidB-like acyl-CoA dehydrogenase